MFKLLPDVSESIWKHKALSAQNGRKQRFLVPCTNSSSQEKVQSAEPSPQHWNLNFHCPAEISFTPLEQRPILLKIWFSSFSSPWEIPAVFQAMILVIKPPVPVKEIPNLSQGKWKDERWKLQLCCSTPAFLTSLKDLVMDRHKHEPGLCHNFQKKKKKMGRGGGDVWVSNKKILNS